MKDSGRWLDACGHDCNFFFIDSLFAIFATLRVCAWFKRLIAKGDEDEFDKDRRFKEK